jgi:hypothetical protein
MEATDAKDNRIRELEIQLAAAGKQLAAAEKQLAAALSNKNTGKQSRRKNPLDSHMHNGGRVRTIKKTFKKNVLPRKKETEQSKMARKRADVQRAALRKANGLYVKSGFVKPTKVILKNEVIRAVELAKDPMFQEDKTCIREAPLHLVKQLDRYIQQVKEILMTPEGKLLEERRLDGETFSRAEAMQRAPHIPWHKYGGNRGVNLGISCVSGGVHGRNGFSGSVHYGKFAVKHWPLCKKILKLLNKMLDDSYGVHWYKQAKVYCAQLNHQSGEERTVGGTVFSGVWLTLETRENATHQDKNVVGATFLCSTYNPTQEKNGALLVQPNKGAAHLIPLPPGRIVGGNWAQSYHNNRNVDEHARQNRTSLVLYLDYRVFSARYKYVAYEGIGFLNK